MSRPLDVLHVTDSLAHGGAEQNLLSLLRRLPRDRFRHHLAWIVDDLRLADSFRPLVDSMVPLGGDYSVRGCAHATVVLRRWIAQHRPDVVHAQLITAQLVARAAALGRRPVVTTWQNAWYDPNAVSEFGGPKRRQLMRLFDAVSSRFNRHFIAVSEHVGVSTAAHLGISPSRVSVIYNAVEPARYAAVEERDLTKVRAELGLREDDLVLLTVGRLVPQKAQVDLIEAMGRIVRRFPKAVLLVAGDGPLADELRARAAACGVADRVRLLGVRRDVPALLQLCKLFLFPSLYEGLSVALVEAVSNGVPVIASDIPQNREVGGTLEAVRFVRPGDVDSLAKVVFDLLGNYAQVRQAALAAQAEVQARFDPSLLAMRFGAVLENAARPRRGA
ncbi:MAG TPA: glycosyltransferase [Polyangia bacterium]|jgi:glycosyltransferase involved in cell wall biosynthesis|nr:glycosyltransferase [Polyangia bacterium]HWE29354.1 glycosyltransferase [Polyangia bacterium]